MASEWLFSPDFVFSWACVLGSCDRMFWVYLPRQTFMKRLAKGRGRGAVVRKHSEVAQLPPSSGSSTATSWQHLLDFLELQT